jgi:hypothetical protein
MLKGGLVGAGAMAFIFVMPASAQEVPSVNMTVDHTFIVSGKALPAGDYTISYDSGSHVFSIMGPTNKANASAVVEARLSRPKENLNPTESRLVFAVVGDQYVLSEIWLPDQNGFLPALKDSPTPATSPKPAGVGSMSPERRRVCVAASRAGRFRGWAALTTPLPFPGHLMARRFTIAKPLSDC